MSVAETKMIAAVVFAACTLLLLYYFVFLLGHTINILFLPLSIVPRDPLSSACHFVLLSYSSQLSL